MVSGVLIEARSDRRCCAVLGDRVRGLSPPRLPLKVPLLQGVGSAADIDASLHLGCNQPMGPLKLADFIGLDTCLAILEVMHGSLGEKYRPCPLLRQHVDAGWLGKKAGRGVYEY